MKVVWTRQVRSELRECWLFLAERSVAHADHVRARIFERGESLAAAPRQGRRIGEGPLRRLSIPDVQFIVTYRVDPDAVRILSVWSTAQDRGA